MPYSKKWRKCRIRLTKADLARHETLVVALLTRAHENSASRESQPQADEKFGSALRLTAKIFTKGESAPSAHE